MECEISNCVILNFVWNVKFKIMSFNKINKYFFNKNLIYFNVTFFAKNTG